jgi:hypothetical protein
LNGGSRTTWDSSSLHRYVASLEPLKRLSFVLTHSPIVYDAKEPRHLV